MSSHLQWMIIRNNSCFLLKRNRISLSKEPNNLKNRNSYRYNGLIHKKTIGIEPAKDGKGVVLITKKSKIHNKPSKTYNKVQMKRDPRRTFATIRKTLRSKRYRKDLKMAAVRRASALLRSQKPVVVRKNLRPKKD